MGYTTEVRNNSLIVHFYGELDHHITEKARLLIDKKYEDKNIKNMVLDLTQLSLMDSSGIGLIMGRYKNIINKKGKLLLISSNTYVDRIIRMSGLTKIIEVYTTLDEALQKLERWNWWKKTICNWSS